MQYSWSNNCHSSGVSVGFTLKRLLNISINNFVFNQPLQKKNISNVLYSRYRQWRTVFGSSKTLMILKTNALPMRNVIFDWSLLVVVPKFCFKLNYLSSFCSCYLFCFLFPIFAIVATLVKRHAELKYIYMSIGCLYVFMSLCIFKCRWMNWLWIDDLLVYWWQVFGYWAESENHNLIVTPWFFSIIVFLTRL